MSSIEPSVSKLGMHYLECFLCTLSYLSGMKVSLNKTLVECILFINKDTTIIRKIYYILTYQ